MPSIAAPTTRTAGRGLPARGLLALALATARAATESEQTQRQMLKEATERQSRNATGNGKFPLATGAWFVTDDYIAKVSKSRRSGGDGCTGAQCAYMLDTALADCLAHFMRGRTVTELGAGIGRYAKHIRGTGLTGRLVAYDGMPDVESKSEGAVHYADLSTRDNAIERSDWAMTLEVAEHVPKQFEATFLGNLDRANTHGVVLSWSRLQGSRGHVHPRAAQAAPAPNPQRRGAPPPLVNPKGPRAVIAQFHERGYLQDRNAARPADKAVTCITCITCM